MPLPPPPQDAGPGPGGVLELEQRGTPEPYETILRSIQERDWNDTHRAAAPLRQAEDAVLLDTTDLDFAQSEAALLDIIRKGAGQ